MMHDFTFDQQVADIFDDMLERSIPFYAEVQRMTVELARRFAQPGTAIPSASSVLTSSGTKARAHW